MQEVQLATNIGRRSKHTVGRRTAAVRKSSRPPQIAPFSGISCSGYLYALTRASSFRENNIRALLHSAMSQAARIPCKDTPLGQAMPSFHPALYNSSSEIGKGVFTSEDLPSGTRLVSCLHASAVTPASCRGLLEAFSIPRDRLSDRQVMAAVLVLLRSGQQRDALPNSELATVWIAYVDSLPQHIHTPLEFSAEERALLQNTNLHGALIDRENEWRATLAALNSSTPLNIAWPDWLWANSIISSRAFPSSLIDNDEINATPILFPSVDSLNHNPTSKVLWLKETDRLTLVTEQDILGNTQCFNNYGPKSNEELLLGYGFVIPDNPADLLAVKLGKPRIPPNSSRTLADPTQLFQHLGIDTERHIILRDGILPVSLLAQMRFYLADEEEQASTAQKATESQNVQEVLGFVSWQNELSMLDQLGSMLELKAEALGREVGLDEREEGSGKRARMNGAGQSEGEAIGPAVRRMVEIYRQAQKDIIQAALAQHEELMTQALEKAQASGEIDIEME